MIKKFQIVVDCLTDESFHNFIQELEFVDGQKLVKQLYQVRNECRILSLGDPETKEEPKE